MQTQKNYLLAGASSAMAVATAKRLHERGHRVIGLSRQPVDGVYDEMHAVNTYSAGDLPPVAGSLHGLVYFPGTIQLKPFARLSAADFTNDLQVHFLGAVAVVQTYLAQLDKAASPGIVFISSVAAGTGMPFHTSVAAAKAALEGFTRALAAELAPQVRVNAVAPSLVDSPLGEKFLNTPEKREVMQKKNPLRRIGTPGDLAAAIDFLLSEEAQWISGQVLAVDGGMGQLKL